MKLRSFFLTLASGVFVLLIIAIGSIYWIVKQSPLQLLTGGVTTEPAATVFVSREAPAMVSLLVNPSRLDGFRQLSASLGERRQARIELNQLKNSILANTGLDYKQEIEPWIGEEITLAVTSLDYDRNEENGVQPGYLLAVNAKDPELAREFVQLSYSQDAIAGTSDLVFEQYKGVNLIYQRPLITTATNPKSLSTAIVGDFVLFANHPKVIKEAINNVQAPDLSLPNYPLYKEAIQTIVNPRIGVSYFNLPAVSAWITNVRVPEDPEIRQTLTVALSLNPQGIEAQTALIGVAEAENPTPVLSAPVTALEYIPSKSILTTAGTNLNQLWSQIATGLEEDSPLQQLINQGISYLERPFGIDLPEDIFSWVQGEYALSLLPASENNKLEDWVFVAEKVPGSNYEEKIDYLDGLAKQQGASVGSIPILNSNVTAWTKLATSTINISQKNQQSSLRLLAEVAGVHTTIDKYEIFASSIDALDKAISGSENSLLANEKFNISIAALPQENEGYFYIDWNEGQTIFEKQIPLIQVVELSVKPLFEHLRSLTLTSIGKENNIRRATVFFNLGK